MESEERDAERIEDAEREVDERIDELTSEADELEERLEENESAAEDVDVPEPGEESEAGLGVGDLVDPEGESAEDAGQ